MYEWKADVKDTKDTRPLMGAFFVKNSVDKSFQILTNLVIMYIIVNKSRKEEI